MAILLALSVYQMIVSEKLPATSDAVPLLGRPKLKNNLSLSAFIILYHYVLHCEI